VVFCPKKRRQVCGFQGVMALYEKEGEVFSFHPLEMTLFDLGI
jgi:hypothetical protein